MIGQATAALEPAPRRWLQRAWGTPYIPRRQDWAVLWPHLKQLPAQNLSVLDAGCGSGAWTLELGALRPAWKLIGLDRGERVASAHLAGQRLGLANVSFVQSDFLAYEPEEPFDLILSVFSAHYLFQCKRGTELFRCFRQWLVPGGILMLLGPRREAEIPFVPWLPHPDLAYVLARDDLLKACRDSELELDTMDCAIGQCGTVAKQLECMARGRLRRVALAGLYPVICSLVALDPQVTGQDGRSFAWLLIAHAPGIGGESQ